MIINPGTVIASRYEIIDKLGSGGMAIVYKAKDLKLDRPVTFKVLREEFINDDEFISRFSVEARAAASLSHQNIVSVYDVGQDEDIRYIVMEYIEGVTLKDLIVRRGAFDNDEALGVAIQIASALEHAHTHNIVHRDIKPQNILVTREGAVKVTDFGIARATSSGTLKTDGTTMGSVHYFSPEQARGGYIDAKSDIYSLGLTMFEMVTGRVPFDGDSPVSVALKQINDPLPDMNEINPNISASVVNIIRKATEKLSGKRYQTIPDMSVDMKHALTDSTGAFVTEEYVEGTDGGTITLSEEDVQYINDMTKDRSPSERAIDFEEEGFTDEDRKAERKIELAAILSAVAIIVVVIALGMNFFLKNKEKSLTPINPPDLIGRTLEEAGQIALQLSINITQVDVKPSEEYPEGQIMSQAVASEDGELYMGGTINVIVSKGTNMIPVPDLVNKDLDEVYEILKETQFTPIDREHVANETVPRNVVISQEPAAGEMASPNADIFLTISRGPELQKTEVPDIIGMTDAEAIAALRDARLQAGHSTTMDSDTVPEGKIISQTVDPGTEVSINTPVAYVISTGRPEPTETPEDEDEEEGEQEEHEEEQQPTQPESSKVLMVNPQPPEGAEQVHIKVLKVTSNTEVVFDGVMSPADLPVNLEVSGSGMVEFQVYFVDESGNDSYQTSEFVDFSSAE